MRKTYYEILGVAFDSKQPEIRSAYRKLVLQHHPDRSKAPDAKERFIELTQAYEVLNDADRRRGYDAILKAREADRIKATSGSAPAASTATERKTAPAPTAPRRPTVTDDLTQLTSLFSKGRYSEAEKLAFRILEKNPGEAIPYGVLGDMARAKGNHAQALNMYAHAIQADPRNPVYQRLYDQLLRSVGSSSSRIEPSSMPASLTLGFGAAICLSSLCYVALSKESPLMPSIGLLSTWSLGLVVMLFLCGVTAGVTLTLSGYLDRFSSVTTSSTGRISPALALSTVAIVNFWAASALYLIISATQNAFNYSTSRVISAVTAIVLLAALAASLSEKINPLQVLLWGGNLTYIGTVCGWMVTDSLRRT